MMEREKKKERIYTEEEALPIKKGDFLVNAGHLEFLTVTKKFPQAIAKTFTVLYPNTDRTYQCGIIRVEQLLNDFHFIQNPQYQLAVLETMHLQFRQEILLGLGREFLAFHDIRLIPQIYKTYTQERVRADAAKELVDMLQFYSQDIGVITYTGKLMPFISDIISFKLPEKQ